MSWLTNLFQPRKAEQNHRVSLRAVRQERAAFHDDLGDIELNKRKAEALREAAKKAIRG
jgi:hypothetical protein